MDNRFARRSAGAGEFSGRGTRMTIKQAAMWLCQPGIVSMIHDPTTQKALSVAVKALAKSELSTNLAEVSTDCISRQAAIAALNEYFARIEKLKRRGLTKGEKAISLDTVGAIKTLPSAEPKRGKWIDKGWTGDWQYLTDGRGNCWRNIVCSECGESIRHESNFCPNCGAKMEVNHESN
jgi:hypothetical protein